MKLKAGQRINDGRLIYMLSDDLFDNGLIQVFSARTGKFVGTYRPGEQVPEDRTDEEIPVIEIPEKHDSQLNLF